MDNFVYLFGLILTLHLHAAPEEPRWTTHLEVAKCDYWGTVPLTADDYLTVNRWEYDKQGDAYACEEPWTFPREKQ